jgi:hypothetical protein
MTAELMTLRVLTEAFVLVASGQLIGMVAALATSRFVAAFLYGMKPDARVTHAICLFFTR